MYEKHPWQNDDTFGSGAPNDGTSSVDCCRRYCLTCDYGRSKSRHIKKEYADRSIVFNRVDHVKVCGMDLYVNSDIRVSSGKNRITLSFHIMTDENMEGPNFEWNHWYHPWQSMLSRCAKYDIFNFLEEIRSAFTVEEFAPAFRHAMSPVFDYAMTKLPMCGNMALWDMLEKEWRAR